MELGTATGSPPSTMAGKRLSVRSQAGLEAGIAAFAAVHLALALLMAAAPHVFYKALGPFGSYNAHYIRDVASFYGALAAAGATSLRREGWRTPVLAVLTIQYALHSANHLADIGGAHPVWTGYFDFATLAAATLLLARLLRWSLRADAARRLAPA